jgi:endonuclease YncB( thermonuclease family)
MFGWRRRNEGFEWREYVRTTILVRRADRQRRIDDARMAALAKVKDTRDKGVAAGQAGLETVSTTIRDVATAALRAIWSAIVATAATTADILRAIWREAASRAPDLPNMPRIPQPRLPKLRFSMPSIRLPNLSMPARFSAGSGLDEGTSGERLRPDIPFRLPFRLHINPQILGGLAFAGLLVVVGGPMLRRGDAEFSPPRAVPTIKTEGAKTAAVAADIRPDAGAQAPDNEISGRAKAIKGDLLRIGGRLVKLASIETPAAAHPCTRSNGRRWNCSAAARLALRRLVGRDTVTCTATGEADNGHLIATCTVDGRDVADELVRKGYAFAAPGFFATYGASEKEAQANRVGVWQGKTLRPEEWRSQVWDEAKRASPDGCPIKGFTRASRRTYAMPWSRGYDSRKIRERRGDRWFCSEEEARSAGFTLAGAL